MNKFNKSFQLNNFLVLFLLLLVGLTVYSPSLKVNFINDEIYFLERNRVENLTSLPTLFEKKDYDEIYYRPFVNFISGLQTLLFNFNSLPYRLCNIIIHSLNAFLVFVLIGLLFKENDKVFTISLLAAFLFILHPIHDYAVIWQTDLFDRIMTLFYLTTLILFVKQKNIFSYLSFLLALLSKEMAFSLPLVIFVISLYQYQGELKQKFLQSLRNSLPYLAIAFLFILFRYTILKNYFLYDSQFHSNLSLMNAFKNYIIYVGLTFFPFYIRELQITIQYFKNYLVILFPIIIMLIFFVLKYRCKLRAEIFGLYFFSLTILLVLRQLMRWYLYLPSIGIILIFAALISKVKYKVILYSISALVILIFILTLLEKQNNWRIASDFVEAKTNSLVSHIIHQKPDEVLFLNLPAKWNDVPIFQLGFEHHLKHYLIYSPDVKVFSKIYMNSLTEEVELKIESEHITLRLNKPSYFILSSEEFISNKRTLKMSDTLTIYDSKFIVKKVDGMNRPTEIELIINNIKPKQIIFLFTKGNFQKIEL